MFWPSENVFEMATISKNEKWGNEHYKIAVHGTLSGDRLNPHVHIYLTNDNRPYNKFNFEISLIDLLCHDEINLIYQRDVSKHKLITNRNKCTWEGYRLIYNKFSDWIFEPTKTPGDFINNLDAIIYWYNVESEGKDDNYILKYISEHGMKVLDKYKKYFSVVDQETYKDCF